MGMGQHIRLLFVFIVSVVVFTVILIFYSPEFDRFLFETRKQEICIWDFMDYRDLNNDGYTENIVYHKKPPLPHLMVRSGSRIFDQFNFLGEMSAIDENSYGDYDNNGLKEIYVFTFHDDSIFLNVVEPYNGDSAYIAKVFIDNYSLYKGQKCHSVHSCGVFDMNGDGFREVVFSVFTGFAASPRRLYSYDLIHDTLIKSPESGSGIIEPHAFDLIGDGHAEFYGDICSFNNCKTDIPFRDDHSYLMVFDHKLNFLFDPVKIGAYPSVLVIKPYIHHNRSFLAVLHKSRGVGGLPSEIMLFDTDGSLIRSVRLMDEDIEDMYLISATERSRDELYLVHPFGKVERLDSSLNVVQDFRINGILGGTPVLLDFDLDGVQEYIFRGSVHNELIVADEKLKRVGKLEAPVNNDLVNIAMVSEKNAGPMVYLQSGDQSVYFSAVLNPYYKWKYLILASAFLVIFFVILGLQPLQLVVLNLRYARERRISELQIRSIKNQVDPHFTLNILNSIGNLFLKNDAEKANYIFGKYAKMLRNTITSSDKISVTLEEELCFVKNYLDLEKYRMQDRFRFEIDTGPEVDKSQRMPKMLIHTFAENAIKHGLKQLEQGGLLRIAVSRNNNSQLIEISDNGIGRAKASEHPGSGTGKGLLIIDEILKIYRRLENTSITYEVKDLTDELGLAAGTKVVVTVPVRKK